MKIFIVTPAYNEEQHINAVLKDFVKSGYSVILVDDGSSDNTYRKAAVNGVTRIKHRINLGKGAALKTGIEYAFDHGADAVVTIDADGQHLIEDISQFVTAIESGKYDIVFGSRNLNYGVPLVRYIGNKFASVLVATLYGLYVSDLICGYRGITKRGYKKIKWVSTGYAVETEMVVRTAQNNLRHCEVPVQTIYLDKYKGVTLLHAIGILFEVIRWKF